VVAATVAFLPFRSALGIEHWAWLYLLVVGAVAWFGGTGPAVLGAVASFLASNFFFTPPYATFTVGDPRDLIQLLVFLLAAVTLGVLTGRLRERELRSERNEAEATALARLASELAEGSSPDEVARTASAAVSRLVGIDGAVVWLADDAGPQAVGPDARLVTARDRALAMSTLEQMKTTGLPETANRHDRLGAGWLALGTTDSCCGAFLPLITSGGAQGVLQVLAGPDGVAEEHVPFLVSVANLLAVFIANRRATVLSAQSAAAEEAERLKSAIISAVSHELKTPLVAVMAAVTDLMHSDTPGDTTEVQARLSAVGEDLERLDGAIGDLLDLSRLQADAWLPRPDLYEAGEIIGSLAAGLHSRDRDRMRFDVASDPSPEVYADFAQIERALRSFVDNALLYSPPGSPVVAGARRSGEMTEVWVEDQGPGIPDAEKEHVFEPFFRGQTGLAAPRSTGLGLAIASDIVHANGGELRVEDGDPHGARFLITVPARPPEGKQ
jgi:two-component system sensor histidine kinase KdpD